MIAGKCNLLTCLIDWLFVCEGLYGNAVVRFSPLLRIWCLLFWSFCKINCLNGWAAGLISTKWCHTASILSGPSFYIYSRWPFILDLFLVAFFLFPFNHQQRSTRCWCMSQRLLPGKTKTNRPQLFTNTTFWTCNATKRLSNVWRCWSKYFAYNAYNKGLILQIDSITPLLF